MNKQMIFDTVRAHLLRQNRPSLDAEGCAYRGADGAMCAVGCLIDDKHYNPDMERDGLGSPLVQETLRLSGINVAGDDGELNEIGELLHDLQKAHDRVADGMFVCDWHRFGEAVDDALGYVAKRHGLKMEALS